MKHPVAIVLLATLIVCAALPAPIAEAGVACTALSFSQPSKQLRRAMRRAAEAGILRDEAQCRRLGRIPIGVCMHEVPAPWNSLLCGGFGDKLWDCSCADIPFELIDARRPRHLPPPPPRPTDAPLPPLPHPASGPSGSITFQVKSLHPHQVGVEFCADSRPGYVWPGDDKHWVIDDWRVHDLPLSCIPGERVCLAAYVIGGVQYWGQGAQCANPCTDCCYVCDGSVIPITLTP